MEIINNNNLKRNENTQIRHKSLEIKKFQKKKKNKIKKIDLRIGDKNNDKNTSLNRSFDLNINCPIINKDNKKIKNSNKIYSKKKIGKSYSYDNIFVNNNNHINKNMTKKNNLNKNNLDNLLKFIFITTILFHS